MQLSNFKLIVIGEENVGKSTWIKKLRTGEIESRYLSTVGVEVYPIRLRTIIENGCGDEIMFKVWDCAGKEYFDGLKEGYYIGSDCAIIMDSTSNSENFDKWNKRVNLNIPKLRVSTSYS